MSNPNVTKPIFLGIDWKGLGYLVSIASVLLLGSVAWPKSNEPGWHVVVLVAGMATSILGMAFRYKAHLDQQRELKRTEAEVRKTS
jgi:Tfp pilus assembly protein PilO